ncbi:hypothetical protein [Brucella cytisi]|uniref:hypothetical protein n=1 Tax=Brucella cytisi TaxID=407152 RepID=UPI00313EE498
MRKLALIAAAFGAALLVIAITFWQVIIRPVDEFLAPATAENARKDMVSAETDAVILMPFVTGDVPRLVRGGSLQKWSRNLWFTSNADAGNVIGATLFALGGMPLTKDIGTAFKAGVPLEKFSCITAGCINWPEQKTSMWGLLSMRDLGAELGPEVRLEHASFTEYNAYRAAHEAISNDPLQWFAEPGDNVPKPDSDGTRQVVITLPTRLMPIKPSTVMPAKNPAFEDKLQSFASRLTDGLDAGNQTINGTDSMPIWVTKNGDYLRGADGSTVALPELAATSPALRLTVKAEDVAIVRERFEAAGIPPADLSQIAPAVADAYARWRITASCLPECGGVVPSGNPFHEAAEMSVSAAPSWSISFWHVPPE